MAIYAIDFDNTLAITRFPEIVAPNTGSIEKANPYCKGGDLKQ